MFRFVLLLLLLLPLVCHPLIVVVVVVVVVVVAVEIGRRPLDAGDLESVPESVAEWKQKKKKKWRANIAMEIGPLLPNCFPPNQTKKVVVVVVVVVVVFWFWSQGNDEARSSCRGFTEFFLFFLNYFSARLDVRGPVRRHGNRQPVRSLFFYFLIS